MSTDDLLEETLAVVRNDELPLEARQQHLASVRKAHPELGPGLDEELVEYCCVQARAIAALEEAVGKLRKISNKLSSPPIREGVYLGRVVLADGRELARVVSRNGEALLEPADDELLGTLQPGDRVLLTSESNAVIGKSAVARPGPGECAVAER